MLFRSDYAKVASSLAGTPAAVQPAKTMDHTLAAEVYDYVI